MPYISQNKYRMDIAISIVPLFFLMRKDSIEHLIKGKYSRIPSELEYVFDEFKIKKRLRFLLCGFQLRSEYQLPYIDESIIE